MFAKCGDPTSTIIPSEKNLPLIEQANISILCVALIEMAQRRTCTYPIGTLISTIEWTMIANFLLFTTTTCVTRKRV